MINIKTNQTFLIAQDLAGVGNLSLGSALTIMQAFDINLALAPTTLLSTQSEGFGSPAKLATDQFLQATLNHWDEIGQQFSGALLAYFEDASIGELFSQWLAKKDLPLVVYDPAFADQGQLYPNITADLLEQKRALLKLADVTCPNLTEAMFLTQTATKKEDPTYYQQLLTKLQELSKPTTKVVITGIKIKGQHGCVWLKAGQLQYALTPGIAKHFYGAGDIFAALLSSFLLEGQSFSKSVNLATKLTYVGLKDSAKAPVEARYGLSLSQVLAKITLERKDADDK